MTPSRIALGAASTASLASLRPRPVSSRTTLMTWIFLPPSPSRTTSNESFSASASAGAAPPPAAATATGAAAVTSKTSSNCFTNSESSMRVISLNAPSSSSVLSFAMSGNLSLFLWIESQTPRKA
ncbi:50S ribosomal protein L7/L12 [Actinoplanes friuliensis DSM 7358]|uniref:50S ribosomal protein L7/L12 n=1 Tax=Actinoplanes friuliensis DSM 7358 TaxID=1246995 RepID=U5VQR7_9ACTN|nr:50S ribosomal protein L7/L12 [Actinoplanes friuliensis DSM 7358]